MAKLAESYVLVQTNSFYESEILGVYASMAYAKRRFHAVRKSVGFWAEAIVEVEVWRGGKRLKSVTLMPVKVVE